MKCVIQIACEKTPDLPTPAFIRNITRFVSQQLDLSKKELTLRVVDSAESQQLNKTYRDQDKPTNVLSFPADHDPTFKLPAQFQQQLGDLVLCHTVIMAEAQAQHKTLADHYTHLIIHGILHLLGHDHVLEAEAQIMEQCEIDLLHALNIHNPYEEKFHGP